MTGFPHDPDLDPVALRPDAEARSAADAATEASAAASAGPDRGPAKGPDIAPAEPDRWRATLPLSHPLTVDGERLDTITCSVLTGERMLGLVLDAGGNEARLLHLARAAIAGVHPDVLSALSADDFMAVVAASRGFLPRLLSGGQDFADLLASAAPDEG